MSQLICALDNTGEIIEGSLGFFKVEQLKNIYSDMAIVRLDDHSFPKDYTHGHYGVETRSIIIVADDDTREEKEIKSLVKKSEDEIKSIPKKEIKISLGGKAVLDIDASSLTGDLRTVVEFLQERLGK